MEPVDENFEHILVNSNIVGYQVPFCFGYWLVGVGSRGNCPQVLRTMETPYNSAAALHEKVKLDCASRLVDVSPQKAQNLSL
jgi:hypothetical protein